MPGQQATAWEQTPPGWESLPCRVWGLAGSWERTGVALGGTLEGGLESLGVTRKGWRTAGRVL